MASGKRTHFAPWGRIPSMFRTKAVTFSARLRRRRFWRSMRWRWGTWFKSDSEQRMRQGMARMLRLVCRCREISDWLRWRSRGWLRYRKILSRFGGIPALPANSIIWWWTRVADSNRYFRFLQIYSGPSTVYTYRLDPRQTDLQYKVRSKGSFSPATEYKRKAKVVGNISLVNV